MSSAIERISALLVKAERTDNPHEADAYLMKAQALATMASIDIAAARAQNLPTRSRRVRSPERSLSETREREPTLT